MLSKKVLALLASFGFLLFLSVGFVSSCSINCECQGAGFDFGIEKFECNNNSPELNNLNYSINVEWALDGENECSGISWNSSPDVAGVLSKEDGLLKILKD